MQEKKIRYFGCLQDNWKIFLTYIEIFVHEWYSVTKKARKIMRLAQIMKHFSTGIGCCGI